MQNKPIAMWIKLCAALYLSIFIPSYWINLGIENFLWFSDIAVILTVLAFWLESALLISAMAVGVLFFELAWLVDFGSRLLLNTGIFGPTGTAYMFDQNIPRFIRGISLSFHLLLPISLIWGLHTLRYDARALWLQTAITWIVYPLCFWFTDPQKNINWTFGPGKEPQSWMPDYLWLLLLMASVPAIIFFPTHYLLKKYFPPLTTNFR